MIPPTSLPRFPRSFASAFFLSIVVAIAVSCAGASQNRTYSGDEPIALELREIVASTTRARLRSVLRHGDTMRSGLATLLARREEISTLESLSAAWSALGPPASEFDLNEKIFATARDDGSWNEEAVRAGFDPAAVPESVDVEGFFLGLRKALTP